MRIHRSKLKLPHPLTVAALAMIWPLLAILLTAAATPAADSASGRATAGATVLQTVEVQADKLWRQVAAVPGRIRTHLRHYRDEGAS